MQAALKWILFILLLTTAVQVTAQESMVPDLTGLNIPQAAAALNQVGLALGAQTSVGWTTESGLPQNTISAQSVAAGSSAAAGAAVDVTVLRSPNVRLVYDDNDITVVNLSGGDLSGLSKVFRH